MTATRAPASAQVALALDELSRLHLDEVPLERVADRVAVLAQRCVPGADQVSVTLLRNGRLSTAAASGRAAVDLDQRQYERGTGPCVDAARSGRTIALPRLDRERRYPDFVAVAWGAGLEATASVGMPPAGRSGGALNLYDFSGGTLDEASVHLAQVFAGYAAVALAHDALAPASVGASGAAPGGDHEAVGRAEGILSARLGCSTEDAAAFLAEQARATSRGVAEVAAELVVAAQRRPPR